jgi:hypothetical protein
MVVMDEVEVEYLEKMALAVVEDYLLLVVYL